MKRGNIGVSFFCSTRNFLVLSPLAWKWFVIRQPPKNNSVLEIGMVRMTRTSYIITGSSYIHNQKRYHNMVSFVTRPYPLGTELNLSYRARLV